MEKKYTARSFIAGLAMYVSNLFTPNTAYGAAPKKINDTKILRKLADYKRFQKEAPGQYEETRTAIKRQRKYPIKEQFDDLRDEADASLTAKVRKKTYNSHSQLKDFLDKNKKGLFGFVNGKYTELKEGITMDHDNSYATINPERGTVTLHAYDEIKNKNVSLGTS